MVGPEDLAERGRAQLEPRHDSRASSARRSAASIVAFAGAGVAFAVNSASFLAELLALLALDTSMLHRPIRDHGATVRRRRARRAALRRALAARRRRVLRRARALDVLFNFNVLLPLVADRTLHSGAQTFGLIAAVFGAGALCGAMMNAVRGQASLRLLLIGAAGYGVFELVLAPQHSLVPVCAAASS